MTPSSEEQWGEPHLMTWLMTIGSGGSRRAVRRWGISENFSRGQSKICSRREEGPSSALERAFVLKRPPEQPTLMGPRPGGGGRPWA